MYSVLPQASTSYIGELNRLIYHKEPFLGESSDETSLLNIIFYLYVYFTAEENSHSKNIYFITTM